MYSEKIASRLKGRTSTELDLQSLLIAARLSFADPTLDQIDIEATCASLLEQGYIKAYIHHSSGVLKLSRVQGFPKLSEVHGVSLP